VSRRLVATDDFDFYADKTPGPLETTVVNDQIRRIGDAVAMLPAHLRVIFLLRHMENLSYADLCKVTGLPEGTVKTHLFRARARIREIVQEEAV
jgi:RNA polymerase sigma-70 factor (ECF subfamily)